MFPKPCPGMLFACHFAVEIGPSTGPMISQLKACTPGMLMLMQISGDWPAALEP